MSEFLSYNPEAEEPKKQLYHNGFDFIRDFEASPAFQEALEQRAKKLQEAHPSLIIDPAEVRRTVRGTEEYIHSIHSFYDEGHTFPSGEGLKELPQAFQDALHEYWDYIAFLERRLPVLRSEYQTDRDMLAQKTIELERQRDKRHRAAARALLGGKLPNIDQTQEAESSEAFSSEEILIGRQLVSLMTEERGLDKADPEREVKKLYRNLYNDNHTPNR